MAANESSLFFAALALPCIPLRAFASGSIWLGVGAFLVQFMVQGAWGVIPAYLNVLVLVREGTRAVLPGFVYQLGNVIAAGNATRNVTRTVLTDPSSKLGP
ncbi:hypothetical protein [Paenarthrobacter sp. PH39-S1]|uniref:hypothetical protein n=1 Tax=Paenarthrobacter sp. PH39-S1 TaxID=3046204 RepID=UPI0024B9B74A|nr:hypothetical protein [Paenarthrobacter sp. PH39-S1]MDJ0355931.1 hypothetical protein [Paenarthrobacter sp. PH39-S1]